MDSAVLTWYAKLEDDAQYEPSTQFYGGTYTGDKALSFEVMLWNNRWGKTDVSDLSKFYIEMFFDYLEDKSLLDYCKVYQTDGTEIKTTIINDRKQIMIPATTVLSGTSNDGSAKNNTDHYLTFTLKFETDSNISLKQNDLKTLCFEIVQQ